MISHFKTTGSTGSSGASTTLILPTFPDLPNSCLVVGLSAWCTGNISPNPIPYVNSVGILRNSVSVPQEVAQQQNGIVGETSRLSLWSSVHLLNNPDPGAYNLSFTINAENATASGMAGAFAFYIYNADSSTIVTTSSSSGGFEWSSAVVSWTTPPANGSFFIGSCIAGDGGYSSDLILPTATPGGAGLKMNLGSNYYSYGQCAMIGGGDTLQSDFSWGGTAHFAAAGLGIETEGVIARVF